MQRLLSFLSLLLLFVPAAAALDCGDSLFPAQGVAPEVAEARTRFEDWAKSFQPDGNVDSFAEVAIAGRSPQDIERLVADGQENYFTPSGQPQTVADGFFQTYAAADGEWTKTVKVTTAGSQGRPVVPPYVQVFYEDKAGGVIRLKPFGSSDAPDSLPHLRHPHGTLYYKLDAAGDLAYANEAFKVFELTAYPKSPTQVRLPEGVAAGSPEAEAFLRRCWTFKTHIPLAGAPPQVREILYPQSPASEELQAIAESIKNLDTPEVPYADLKRESRYLVRIAPRKYVLDENNRILDTAILGTKPFVFVTTPESIYGKPLLDIYLDIGYEAEDIIRWQKGAEMVAIVFRYPDGIGFSDERSGQLPQDWRQQVYAPTWSNVFALFARLAREADIKPEQKGEYAPEMLFFRSAAERQFVLGFPPEGKKRLRRAGYHALKATAGADWAYRDLLEKKLSIFEHFRGTGRTLNETVDPDGLEPLSGLLEFVGPNMKIKDLAEVAIVHLGTLGIGDTYYP